MKIKSSIFFKIIAIAICFLLCIEQSSLAQVAGQIDISGHIAAFRNSITQDKFRPLHLRYLQYNPQANNFRLLLDKGNLKNPGAKDIETASKELLKYFLIGVSLPNDSFWVNLRPDGEDNVIDPLLAQTDIGKVLLEADVQLKKDTALATSPDTKAGKEYWDKLYRKAEELFGSQNVTIPTLTRPWVVPGEIIIRETDDNAYIYKATLKVTLEEDYLKGSEVYNFKDERLKELNTYASQILREKIIPKLTQEVNTSKRYAALRQVYYSLILAQWFKQRFSGKAGLYSRLIDTKNLNGLTSKESWSKVTYFQQYQKSFKDGEYNLKALASTPFGQTIRSYFSGGVDLMGQSMSAARSAGSIVTPGHNKKAVPEALVNRLPIVLAVGGTPDRPIPKVLEVRQMQATPGSSITERQSESNSNSWEIRAISLSSINMQEDNPYRERLENILKNLTLEELCEILNRIYPDKIFEPKGILPIIDMQYYAKGAYKRVYKLTLYTISHGEFNVCIAFKAARTGSRGISQEEVNYKEQLGLAGIRVPRAGKEFLNEQGEITAVMEEFIDGPTAEDLFSTKDRLTGKSLLTDEDRKDIIAIVVEALVKTGVAPEDINRDNFIRDKATGEWVFVDPGSERTDNLERLLKAVNIYYAYSGENWAMKSNFVIYDAVLASYKKAGRYAEGLQELTGILSVYRKIAKQPHGFFPLAQNNWINLSNELEEYLSRITPAQSSASGKITPVSLGGVSFAETIETLKELCAEAFDAIHKPLSEIGAQERRQLSEEINSIIHSAQERAASDKPDSLPAKVFGRGGLDSQDIDLTNLAVTLLTFLGTSADARIFDARELKLLEQQYQALQEAFFKIERIIYAESFLIQDDLVRLLAKSAGFRLRVGHLSQEEIRFASLAILRCQRLAGGVTAINPAIIERALNDFGQEFRLSAAQTLRVREILDALGPATIGNLGMAGEFSGETRREQRMDLIDKIMGKKQFSYFLQNQPKEPIRKAIADLLGVLRGKQNDLLDFYDSVAKIAKEINGISAFDLVINPASGSDITAGFAYGDNLVTIDRNDLFEVRRGFFGIGEEESLRGQITHYLEVKFSSNMHSSGRDVGFIEYVAELMAMGADLNSLEVISDQDIMPGLHMTKAAFKVKGKQFTHTHFTYEFTGSDRDKFAIQSMRGILKQNNSAQVLLLSKAGSELSGENKWLSSAINLLPGAGMLIVDSSWPRDGFYDVTPQEKVLALGLSEARNYGYARGPKELKFFAKKKSQGQTGQEAAAVKQEPGFISVQELNDLVDFNRDVVEDIVFDSNLGRYVIKFISGPEDILENATFDMAQKKITDKRRGSGKEPQAASARVASEIKKIRDSNTVFIKAITYDGNWHVFYKNGEREDIVQGEVIQAIREALKQYQGRIKEKAVEAKKDKERNILNVRRNTQNSSALERSRVYIQGLLDNYENIKVEDVAADLSSDYNNPEFRITIQTQDRKFVTITIRRNEISEGRIKEELEKKAVVVSGTDNILSETTSFRKLAENVREFIRQHEGYFKNKRLLISCEGHSYEVWRRLPSDKKSGIAGIYYTVRLPKDTSEHPLGLKPGEYHVWVKTSDGYIIDAYPLNGAGPVVLHHSQHEANKYQGRLLNEEPHLYNASAWDEAAGYFADKDTKGGIDFRGLPIVRQPMPKSVGTAPFGRPSMAMSGLVPNIKLDKEWSEIENMLNSGIIPSIARIREYLALSCKSEDCQVRIDKTLSCIADILRIEEERCSVTEAALKQLLVLLESDKPANELQLALLKVTVLAKELITIK